MSPGALPLAVLGVPAAVALVLLAVATVRTLGPARAALFWGVVLPYGVVRGILVRRISTGIGGEAPYVVADARVSLLGIPLVEPVGWGVAAALALLVALRFGADRKPPGFVEPFVAALTLGATAFAVECASAAAGWWHWSVPAKSRFFGPVPTIGLVDWALVASDVLLPYFAFTRPAPRLARFGSLLLFPLHFSAHLAPDVALFGPARLLDVAHLLLAALLVGLALGRSTIRREPAPARAFPLAAGLLVAGTCAAAAAVASRLEPAPGRLALAAAPLPLAALLAVAFLPRAVPSIAAAGGVGALALPAAVLAIPLAALGPLLARAFSRRRVALAAGIGALLLAVAVGDLRRSRLLRLTSRLEAALLLREVGRLEESLRAFSGVVRDFPGEAAPRELRGEIAYSLGRLPEARLDFEEALRIRPTALTSAKHLVVIDLRERRPDAATLLDRALALHPQDPELRWLRHRRGGGSGGTFLPEVADRGPEAALALASLSFEIDDRTGAAEILDAAIGRFGEEPRLLDARRAVSR